MFKIIWPGTEKNRHFITHYISSYYIFTIFSASEKSFSYIMKINFHQHEKVFPYIMKIFFHILWKKYSISIKILIYKKEKLEYSGDKSNIPALYIKLTRSQRQVDKE